MSCEQCKKYRKKYKRFKNKYLLLRAGTDKLRIEIEEIKKEMNEKRKDAMWVAAKNPLDWSTTYSCSNCGSETLAAMVGDYNYCPYCGCSMGLERDFED